MNNGYISLYENSSMENPEKYHNLQVYQIAEAHIPPDGVIEEHIQICDEITYALSGKALPVLYGIHRISYSLRFLLQKLFTTSSIL